MESGRALLLIADISGYTEYMGSHRLSLAHAEATTARLLDTVTDAARDFDIIEIEGDAAFLYRHVRTYVVGVMTSRVRRRRRLIPPG